MLRSSFPYPNAILKRCVHSIQSNMTDIDSSPRGQCTTRQRTFQIDAQPSEKSANDLDPHHKVKHAIDFDPDSKVKHASEDRRNLLAQASRRIGQLSLAVFAGHGLGPWVRTAHSQSRHNIRWLVPTPPGSSVDIAARRIAERLRQIDGRAHIVENRPGAGGTIAASEVARSPADGHHYFVGFNGPLATAHLLYPKLSYHPLRDLKPVIATVSQPHVLVVPSQGAAAAKNLAEFVSLMKASPGRFQYASVGNASASHLTMELFKAEAGFFMVHIPYQGGPSAVLATMQDQVQALFTAFVNVQAPIQQGRLRVLAQAQAQASPALSNTPRFADLGYPRVNALLFNAVAAPAGTADALIDQMNQQINAVLAEASIKDALAKSGMDPIGGTSQAMAQLLAQEEARWAPIVKSLRIEMG